MPLEQPVLLALLVQHMLLEVLVGVGIKFPQLPLQVQLCKH